MCKADEKSGGKKKQGGQVSTVQEGIEDSNEHSYVLNQIIANVKPITVEVVLYGRFHPMELDTSAVVSLMSEKTHRPLFPDTCLHNSFTEDLLRGITQGSGIAGC